MTDIIETSALTKRYGQNRGVHDVTFSVSEGEVFGFLGPNGAGKTTTIRLLMGLLRPTGGSAQIGGLDCWSQATDVKRLIGYLPGEFNVDPAMTGAQIIEYLGNLRGGVNQHEVKRLVERLEFDPGKRFRDYSRGNKQKVGLIQAFMHKPRLLILDEPTGGLDPLNQQEFSAMVTEVKAEGRTVFLSSHILPEVEHLCDRVGIIREGELVRVDHIAALKDLRHHVVTVTFPSTAATEWFDSLPNVSDVTLMDGGESVQLTAQADLAGVIQIAAQHHAVALSVREPSLDEVFLRYYQPEPVAKG
ncbi:MAG: ABC transporter ATP-binding protein [Chloroflexota bacterium]|nr:ABC transporter ATP-binding protein [Chloroflexota bacterium]